MVKLRLYAIQDWNLVSLCVYIYKHNEPYSATTSAGIISDTTILRCNKLNGFQYNGSPVTLHIVKCN